MAAMSTPAMRALALRSAAMNHHYGVPAGQPGKQPGRGSGVSVIPPRRPAPPHVSQTVSQVATQRVNQALAPQLADQQAQADRQNAAIQAFAQQLLGKLQPIAGQVGADYNQAIGQTASLANGAADALRNANPNQQDQQLLAALGAPASQHADIANNLANTFGGGAAVLQVGQGQIPGSMLASNKASAQAFANTLPATAALKGEQDLASAMYQQGQDRQHIRDQAPGMILSESQNIHQNNQARANLAWDQTKFNTARNDALNQASSSLSNAKGYVVNKQGQFIPGPDGNPQLLPGWKINKNGQMIPPPKAGSTGTWRAIASGGGTYVLVNSKTGAQKVTDIPVKKNATTGKTASLQLKNIGGKVAYFNPKTGKLTQTSLPYGSPKSKSAGSTPYDPAFPHLKQAGVQHLQSGIANAYKGIDPKTGGPVKGGPVTYQEAIQDMVQGGYSRAAATRMANRFYVHPWQRTGGWKRGMPGPAGG